MTTATLAADHRPATTTAPTAVIVWLIACAGMVFAMTVIGAITRLTESGLSMVEWRPLIGAIPPLSDAEWQRVFDLYRDTPEYRLRNAGMGLEAFKTIFFWEWLHRLWGRLIGVVFAVPFLWFWLRGRLPRGMAPKLFGLLVLGGLQGVLGWYMVQSGLIDRPSVSHYRLAAHLGLALVIYALLVWLILDAIRGGRPAAARAGGHAWGTLGVLAVTIVWGAFVAGMDAGLAYNTWPLMGGVLLPPEAWALSPAWLNAVDNTAMVQFIHRWLGIVTLLAALSLAWGCVRNDRPGLGAAVAAASVAQVGIGIATLLTAVAIPVAALHQAGAVVLLTLVVSVIWVGRGR